MRGSSGGGVALPEDWKPPPQLSGVRAVAVSSVPMAPSQDPPTGLHLWYTKDEQLLQWTEYRNSSSVQSSTNATCVICPADVPAEARAGYIGDNYMWLEKAVTPSKYNFYVLSGSTRCAAGHPWCSYKGIGGNATAQAFVFRSTDLLHWELISNWDFLPTQATGVSQWPAQHIDTPETFPVASTDGGSAQAFVWLNGPVNPECSTQWMLGQMNSSTKDFTASTHFGCADKGSMFCQQSLDTADNQRVSIGWIRVAGLGWDGAQSLPRVVTMDHAGLVYAPLQALETLHRDYRFWRHHIIQAGTTVSLSDVSVFGGHAHIILRPRLSSIQQLTFSVLGGACEILISPIVETCKATEILNNTDTHGAGKLAKSVPANASITVEWCREICCADQTCVAWTFAVPLLSTNGTTFDCWTKSVSSGTLPSSCKEYPGEGHCWSGQIKQSERSGGWWQVAVNGTAIGSLRTPSSSGSFPSESTVQVFVDGSIVEVYYGGEVVSKVFEHAVSQDVAISVGGPGDVLLQLEAWRMDASVVGSEK